MEDHERIIQQLKMDIQRLSAVAQFIGIKIIGIIMTGMGNDGSRGLLEMHEGGAKTKNHVLFLVCQRKQ